MIEQAGNLAMTVRLGITLWDKCCDLGDGKHGKYKA